MKSENLKRVKSVFCIETTEANNVSSTFLREFWTSQFNTTFANNGIYTDSSEISKLLFISKSDGAGTYSGERVFFVGLHFPPHFDFGQSKQIITLTTQLCVTL